MRKRVHPAHKMSLFFNTLILWMAPCQILYHSIKYCPWSTPFSLLRIISDSLQCWFTCSSRNSQFHFAHLFLNKFFPLFKMCSPYSWLKCSFFLMLTYYIKLFLSPSFSNTDFLYMTSLSYIWFLLYLAKYYYLFFLKNTFYTREVSFIRNPILYLNHLYL